MKEFKKKGEGSKEAGKWDRFFGILSEEQADEMTRIIEEEFEQIEDEA